MNRHIAAPGHALRAGVNPIVRGVAFHGGTAGFPGRETEVVATAPRIQAARLGIAAYRSLGSAALFGFAFAIFLIVAIGAVALIELRRTNEAGNLVRQTFEVQDDIDAVLRHLLDAESGQRGYLLTGDRNYLGPFQKAMDAFPGDVERLRAATARDPGQSARLEEVIPILDGKLAELESSVHLRTLEGPQAALEVIQTDYGRRATEDIRRRLGEMRDVEQRLLGERLALRERTGGRATQFVLLGSILAALIVGTATAAMNRATRRRLAMERELRDSSERLRVTLRSIGDAVIATDASGVVMFVNPVAQALTGWAEDEARGRPLEEVFSIVGEETRECVEGPVAKVMRLGTVVGLANHTLLLSRDGRETPIDDSGAPIRDSDGTIAGVVLVFRDASERRRAQAERERTLRAEIEKAVTASALRRTDAERGLLQTIFDTAPIGLAFFDRDLRFVRVNRALADMDGMAAEAHLGRSMDEVLPRFGREPSKALRDVLQTGDPVFGFDMVGETPAAPGSARSWRASYVPVRSGDGAVLGVAAVVEDVTERRRAELEREHLYEIAEQARAEAVEANRAKDEFLAIVSHELRSPLSAMAGWIRILAGRCSGDETIDRALHTLERNIRVQTQIIADLLDVSRFLSGKLALESRIVDVALNVLASVESIRPIADERGVSVECEVACPSLAVRGDPDRLAQVFTNLLNNAVKFTSRGGRVRVAVAYEEASREASIRVRDTGVGIDAALLPHVFERFRQGESPSTRTHGGLGLGLAIVKHLVDLHGGSVRADSDGPGTGATFTVRLPVADAVPAVVGARPAAAAGRVDGRGLHGLRLLLVEDDADSRESLEILLREQGVDVVTATSYAEALAAFDGGPVDIVVSDIGLPGASGYDLVRTIRARENGGGARVLAVAMTGFAGKQDHEEALRAGFDEHVGKPLDVDAFLERIRVLAAALPERATG
ncbi:MAG TPA: PAS domain-containing protein [Candidatus Binatia bacterium]|nr:PAS domain-containing protein [Candidatus Binatia bacterium]